MDIKFDDLPKSVDFELEVLSSMLLKDGRIVPKIAAILEPDDFYSGRNQIVYRAILDLHNRGIVPNIITLIEELKKVKDFDKPFLEWVINLGNYAFTDAYTEKLAATIKEKSIRRKLIYFANALQRDAINPQLDFDTFMADTESAFRAINDDVVAPALISQNEYFAQIVQKDIETSKLYANRKSGFDNIDEHQIFSPGLYVVGATPAAGKTTFCWQLLAQLAANGETCIFCSYEMSALELYSKTLARELFQRDSQATLTAADIRRGAFSPELEKLMTELASNKNKNVVNLLELRDESVDDMLRIIRPYCTDKKKSPVICLDYLQIVPPTRGEKFLNDKARIDDIVHKLKTFQRETNTTFIVVSSFNRMNYMQQVAFESFKESGNIEYTADVIWGLQLAVANNIQIGEPISETRKKFEKAKKEQPRRIHLKCLKNRQGMNYDCFFNYYSAHDYFKVDEDLGGFKDEDNSGVEDDENTKD